MSFLDVLGNNPKQKLINIDSFDAKYHIVTRNEFSMGKENPVISLETKAEILFSQDAGIFKITNAIETNSINGCTESETMKPHLEQMLLLAGISKKIVIERNLQGKLKSVSNLSVLRKDWEYWKAHKLGEVFVTKIQQQKFIENYEKGLAQMDAALENNFQYVLLMPEIYHFKQPVAGIHSNKTSEMQLASKLVADMPVRYNFKSTALEHDTTHVYLAVTAEMLNKQQLVAHHLKPVYEKHKTFSIADYDFQMDMNYCIQKNNSKIKTAGFRLSEKLHDHLFYKLSIELKEI